eukprot:9582771-Karenia_brevis.AAC.1
MASYKSRFYTSELEPVCPISYTGVLKLCRQYAQLLGAEALNLTTHTFRRSGASELHKLGVNFADTCLFGRWLSDKAAREYIRKGE